MIKRHIFLILCIIQTWWQARLRISSLEYSHFNAVMWGYSFSEKGKQEFQLYRESLLRVFLDLFTPDALSDRLLFIYVSLRPARV